LTFERLSLPFLFLIPCRDTAQQAKMDRASQALAAGLPFDAPRTYAALAEHSEVPLSTLHHRAHGRRSREQKAQSQQYLTPQEEQALAKFLLQMSGLGSPVRIKFLPSLAFIVARQRSTTNTAIKPPGKNWAQAFEKRHPELKTRRVRAIDWKRHEINIYEKITYWFKIVKSVLQDPRIKPWNVWNMDETGVMLSMQGSVKVLVGKDDPRDYRGAGVKRIMVTAIECVSMDGRSLLPMIIWPAKTHRANWTTYPTPGWHFARSESGYTDSKVSLEWIKRVFDPQTKARANGLPRVLICDGFGSHESLGVLEFCFENNITLCRLPSHTSHKLQPCDVGLFGPLKAAYRDEVEVLYRGGVNTVRKEHFTALYSPARNRALTPKNIKAAWAACGLSPWDPDRVLRNIPKPASLTIPDPCEQIAAACSATDVVQAPVTPTTPTTSDALTSLHKLITEHTDTLDEVSKRHLQKHVQKLANAAQISFADRAILREQARFLHKINNEAKHRRSTKSEVVGDAKVMSYKDIVEARVKIAEKKKASAGKGKRGRKRKSNMQEVDSSELRAPVAQMI
jgi:hypothetical protein